MFTVTNVVTIHTFSVNIIILCRILLHIVFCPTLCIFKHLSHFVPILLSWLLFFRRILMINIGFVEYITASLDVSNTE